MALSIIRAGGVFNGTSGNKQPTFSIGFSRGDLVVVFCAGTGVTDISVSDNNPDGHGTYEQVASALKNGSADQLVAFVRSDFIQSLSGTTVVSVQTGSTGGGLSVYKITGMSLAGPEAIRQSGVQENQPGGAAPATPLGVAALTTNGLIAAVFDGANPPTLTDPVGWTNDDGSAGSGLGYTPPTTGFQAARIASGFTGSTVTWGTSDATPFASIAVELDASPAGFMGAEGEEHSSPFSLQLMDRTTMIRAGYY